MLAWVKYCVFHIALSCSSSKLALLEFYFSHKPICFPFPNSCTQLCPTLCAPCTVARQAPLSMGILQSRILEWVTMSSRDLPNLGLNLGLPLQADSLPAEPPGSPGGLYMWSTSCNMLNQMKQAGIKIARRNSNNLRYADDITLKAESKEELKSLLMKLKEDSEKTGLKFNIQKTKIIVSSPISSWLIDGEKVETMTDFIFLGSKITADSDNRHEIKRHFLLGRKAITHLDSTLKSRDITFLTKVHLVKAVISPVVMNRCESWTIKKAEPRRIDAFELRC